MKNKYLLILFFIAARLFLNADAAFGNSIYKAENKNLDILLKKYDITLAKSEIIPVNINKKRVKNGSDLHNRIFNYRYNDSLMQKVSLAGRGSVKSA